MLEGEQAPGITNLLAAEAQFGDIIHSDHFSDCHVVPVGTANAARAMRAADRLPMILSSLSTVYDLIVIECGSAGSAGIRRLVAENSALLVSVLDPEDEAVAAAASELRDAGYEGVMLVAPEGYAPPPQRGQRAA
jgi:Mrp family chromosome partitioning ATPase